MLSLPCSEERGGHGTLLGVVRGEAVRRRCGEGMEAWGKGVWSSGSRSAGVGQRVRLSGARATLLRPSGAATLTGLISNMMHTASMVSLTPAGGDFIDLTSVMSSLLSVLSAWCSEAHRLVSASSQHRRAFIGLQARIDRAAGSH